MLEFSGVIISTSFEHGDYRFEVAASRGSLCCKRNVLATFLLATSEVGSAGGMCEVPLGPLCAKCKQWPSSRAPGSSGAAQSSPGAAQEQPRAGVTQDQHGATQSSSGAAQSSPGAAQEQPGAGATQDRPGAAKSSLGAFQSSPGAAQSSPGAVRSSPSFQGPTVATRTVSPTRQPKPRNLRAHTANPNRQARRLQHQRPPAPAEVTKAFGSTEQPNRPKVVDFINLQARNFNVFEHVAKFTLRHPTQPQSRCKFQPSKLQHPTTIQPLKTQHPGTLQLRRLSGGMAMQLRMLSTRSGYATAGVAGSERLCNLGGCQAGLAM